MTLPATADDAERGLAVPGGALAGGHDPQRVERGRAPTELQKEKWTSLQKLTDETYFGIITGQVPVDAFDEYVTTWKAQGGDEILAEINEWWANR